MKKTKTQNKGLTWMTCQRCGAEAASFVYHNGARICIACYNALCAGGK